MLVAARRPLLLVLAALGVLLGGCGTGTRPAARVAGPAPSGSPYRVSLATIPFPRGIARRTVGIGAARVSVFSPAGRHGPLPTVLLLHGWLAIDPAYYRPWIVHLVREGNVVVHPDYQVRRTPPSAFLDDTLRALREVTARLRIARGSLVVLGHSAGATLAADYAAVACPRHLPVPQAVMAIFPAARLRAFPEPLPGAAWQFIPRRVQVEVLAGAQDRVVGALEAHRIVAADPRARYVLLRERGADTHLAPQEDTSAVRTALWRRFDALMRSARARPPVACS